MQSSARLGGRTVACAKPPKGRDAPPASKAGPSGADEDEGENEDGWMEDDEFAGEGEDEDDAADDGDGGLSALGIEDDEAPGVTAGGVAWGEAGLKAAEKVRPGAQ
jgi:hypothetical protein